MRSVSRVLVLALSVTGSAAGVRGQVAEAAATPGAGGHWEGTISMPEGPVAFSADLSRTPRGTWIGSMTVLGSPAVDVPLSDIVVSGTSATFHAGLIENPHFAGTLSADGNELSGDVANAKGAVPFQLKRSGSASVSAPPPSTPFSKATDIEGSWEGTLIASAKTTRVVLRVFAAQDGASCATLVNLDRGNVIIPIATVTWSEKQLRLESRAVSGLFVGKMNADGAIEGEWTQGQQKVPLTFKRGAS